MLPCCQELRRGSQVSPRGAESPSEEKGKQWRVRRGSLPLPCMTFARTQSPSTCCGCLPPQQAEIISASMRSLCGRLRSRLLAFIDNKASLGALIAGKSTSSITRAIVELAADWECSSCPGVWYERVASHPNPADAPSRFSCDGLDPSRMVTVRLDDLIREVIDLEGHGQTGGKPDQGVPANAGSRS